MLFIVCHKQEQNSVSEILNICHSCLGVSNGLNNVALQDNSQLIGIQSIFANYLTVHKCTLVVLKFILQNFVNFLNKSNKYII